MADLSNSSFIPKRGPVKRSQKSSSRQVYLFTLISYVFMFATLLGAGGAYFYSGYIEKQLAMEVSALNTEISSFNQADMQRVMEFDMRLQQASDRLDNSASVVSIFKALEVATIDKVKIDSLSLIRELDDKFLLSASIETDSFDSTIFQRGVYKRNNEAVSEVSFLDLDAPGLQDSVSGTEGANDTESSDSPLVTFKAEIEIPLSAVPYEPSATVSSPLDSSSVYSASQSITTSSEGEMDASSLEDNQSEI